MSPRNIVAVRDGDRWTAADGPFDSQAEAERGRDLVSVPKFDTRVVELREADDPEIVVAGIRRWWLIQRTASDRLFYAKLAPRPKRPTILFDGYHVCRAPHNALKFATLNEARAFVREHNLSEAKILPWEEPRA
jgi:hypothetical protein